ncbi:hypothetical protein HDV00_003598 [Rhizophlyctis rosea]|nr:hypothetical protein HDV00_003598 [Rhizophlyctis rosea]
MAADLKRRIIPIRLDDGPFTWSLAITAGLNYVDFAHGSAEVDWLLAMINKPPLWGTRTSSLLELRIQQLKAMLKPVDSSLMWDDVKGLRRQRYPGTRDWVLKEIRRWAKKSFPSPLTFWLEAPPGAGKSVLAAEVIEDLASSGHSVAFFSCKSDHTDHNNPSILIRTIAYQLALKFPAVAQHLLRPEASQPSSFADIDIPHTYWQLIADPLHKLPVIPQKNIVIVLDALDECGKLVLKERADLADALGHVKLPRWVKLLLISSPSTDLHRVLHPLVPYRIDLDGKLNLKDLLVVAQARMAEIFKDDSREVNMKRAKGLVVRSSGLFIWLHHAIEGLRVTSNGSNAYDPLLGSRSVNIADRMMDKVYYRLLRRALRDDGDKAVFRAAFAILAIWRVPVHQSTLTHVLDAQSARGLERMLNRIPSLWFRKDHYIRVVHKSFADFVTDPNRCKDPDFYINPSHCPPKTSYIPRFAARTVTGVRLPFIQRFIDLCGGTEAFTNLTTEAVNEMYIIPQTKPGQSICEILQEAHSGDIGPANWFISHTWQYSFLDLVDSITSFFPRSQYNDVILWIDIFSLPQHGRETLDTQWLSTQFISTVSACTNVLMVLSPWYDPAALKRAWCVYELYASAATHTTFHTVIPPSQFPAFHTNLMEQPDRFYQTITSVNSANSRATSDLDEISIHLAISQTVGFEALDRLVSVALLTNYLEIMKSLFGVDHAETLRTMESLASLHVWNGQLDAAEALYGECLERRTRVFGRKDSHTIEAREALVRVYSLQGKQMKVGEMRHGNAPHGREE